MNKELLRNIYRDCKKGLSEREIKTKYNLTDWDYMQARKILAHYEVDYEY